MKGLQVVTAVGGVALAGVGVAMAMTNPQPAIYEEYAVTQITEYVQENLCPKAPNIFGQSFQNQCRSVIESNQSEIERIVSKGTQRQNFILFSIYQTDVSINTVVPFFPANVLPAYHFESVGAFNNFYTYKAKKQ
jgi:hypothetical protein